MERMSVRSESMHFNFLWEEAILPAIEICTKEMHSNFLALVTCNDPNKYKKAIESLYREKREWLKKLYLHNKVAENEEKANLDMHKIAAILIRSIIGCKYFVFDQKKTIEIAEALPKEQRLGWLKDNAYINYKLAYYVGLKVIKIDLLYSYLRKDGNEFSVDADKERELKYIIENGIYEYPENGHHGDFETSMIVMLMKNDVNGRDFDYLGIATILFQIEEVTKLSVHYEVTDEQQRNAYKEAEEKHAIEIKTIKTDYEELKEKYNFRIKQITSVGSSKTKKSAAQHANGRVAKSPYPIRLILKRKGITVKKHKNKK